MKEEWKHLFSNVILQRGKQYFNRNAVRNFEKYGDVCECYVYGSSIYDVEITLKDGNIEKMKCTCPHAMGGNNCKHMAAALYYMEDSGIMAESFGKSEKSALKEVFPFRRDGEKEAHYRYYDLEKITKNYMFCENDVQQAEQLIEEGAVSLGEITEGAYSRAGRFMQVDGIYRAAGGKNAEISVRMNSTEIIFAVCDVPGCLERIYTAYMPYADKPRRLCIHLTALLILTERYIEEYNPGDATDYSAYMLLRKYRRNYSHFHHIGEEKTEIDKYAGDIVLEPRLEIGEDCELGLSFKVGRNKLYVVKNIPELIRKADSGEELKLGKKEIVYFDRESFDDESKKYFEFIKKEIRGEEIRNQNLRVNQRYSMVPEGAEIKGTMPLYGKRLDLFFELAKGGSVPFIRKERRGKSTGEALFTEKMPDVKLFIDKAANDRGEFEGVTLTGTFPHMISGIEFRYYFDGKNLNRADNEQLELLELLGDSCGSKISLSIGRKNLSEFYYRVLPLIKEFAQVTVRNRSEIIENLYPEVEFIFFLDAENDNVSCSVSVIYGEHECVISDMGIEKENREEFRDVQRESEAAECIKQYLPFKDEEKKIYHCGGDEDMIYRMVENGVDSLLKFGEVQATDRFKNLTIYKKPQITVGVRLESDLLNLTISSGDLTEEELLEIIHSYRRRKKYHRLKNGSFVKTDDSSIEELSAMLEVMHVSPADFVKGKMQLPAYRALYLDKMLEKNDTLYTKRDTHFKNLVKNFKTVTDSDYEVPESLQDTVRNYQDFGYKWLRTVESCGFGGILADDMGLGKTLQMIAVLLAAKKEGTLKTAMIVVPASLVFNWKEEFAKFAPELNAKVIAGTKQERKALIAGCEENDVIITSYDLLKRDILNYEGKEFTYQVIDEAQYIKNHTTAAAKAVKAINSKFRFALTGTPIENRLSELWSIFDFLMPGFLYSYEKFRKEIELPISKNKDEEVMARLKRMAEPFILRRLKNDVLRDLPEKIEDVQYVVFDREQQRLYDGQALHMKAILQEQNDENYMKNKMKILAEITRIRQICCDPLLCFENYKGASAKREACIDLVQSGVDGGHKILIFSQFTSMLRLLEADLEKAGISYYKITGSTKKEERIDLVNRFNTDDTGVFLISLKAGGTGLNLTGADIVIHFDPWWNLAAQNQATDRAHRIGQKNTVSVYKLIAKNSIEEKILKLQESKKALADEILSGETGGLMTMSREDLMNLL